MQEMQLVVVQLKRNSSINTAHFDNEELANEMTFNKYLVKYLKVGKKYNILLGSIP